MKVVFYIALWGLSCQYLLSQSIKGKIIDAETKQPIGYASIGVKNTTIGTVTDEQGTFELQCRNLPLNSMVRVSMIGYEPVQYRLTNLRGESRVVELVKTSYPINEIVISPKTERQVGATGFSKRVGWSGWNAKQVRRGYEIGVKVDLGDNPSKIKNFHVMFHRQAFDTSYYRLHIRRMIDTLVLGELLKENIIVAITKESGWSVVNLEGYNLIFDGEIAVSLELLKVTGLNPDRAMKINGEENNSYILFKNATKQTGLYRWGPEAKWWVSIKKSPSMHLTVLE